MLNEIEQFLQTILDNKTALFSEYESNRSVLPSENISDDTSLIVAYDIENIHINNNSFFPILNDQISNGNGISIMGCVYANIGVKSYQSYQLRWSQEYPVERFYISDGGHNSIAKIVIRDDKYTKFVDWKTGIELDFTENDYEFDSYLVLDIWSSETPPTPEQIKNFFISFENRIPNAESEEFKSYINANKP